MIATAPIDAALARVAERIPADTRVGDAMRYALDGGGKRLRPALVVAAYEAVTGSPAPPAVADIATAVELIHTYSLMHDDLPCMDDDDVRRGRATTHRMFGEATAVLAGAALIPLAFETADDAARALGVDAAVRVRIAQSLAHAAGAVGMVGGQVMDIAGEAHTSDLAKLEETHAAKTGALLRCACRLGALAAGASEAQLAAIDRYGAHMGLAFQITDDVLDETATTAELGKTAGKDRALARATFPALMGTAAASERAVTEMLAAIEALDAADLERGALADLCRFAVERKR